MERRGSDVILADIEIYCGDPLGFLEIRTILLEGIFFELFEPLLSRELVEGGVGKKVCLQEEGHEISKMRTDDKVPNAQPTSFF